MKNWQITLLGLSLILSSCSSQVSTESDETVITDDPTDDYIVEDDLSPEEADAKAEEIAKQNHATYKTAVSTGDITACSQIESYDLKFSCEQNAIFNSAILNNDILICAKLTNEKSRLECESKF